VVRFPWPDEAYEDPYSDSTYEDPYSDSTMVDGEVVATHYYSFEAVPAWAVELAPNAPRRMARREP
jgi:hypothetical protein